MDTRNKIGVFGHILLNNRLVLRGDYELETILMKSGFNYILW